MMNADPGPTAGDPEDERRHLRRLVSSLRAHGGVGVVAVSCHQDVPDVDGVVLTADAAHAGRIILSDSGPHGDQLEDLYAVLGEGPGIDSAAMGEAVTAVDLEHPYARTRWPRFADQASTLGIRAVFVYPLLLHRRPIGVLSAYRAVAGPLSATDHDQVRRHGKGAAVIFQDSLPATDNGWRHFVLPTLAGKVQQAVGIVMESAAVDAPTALHRLRAYARLSSRPMRDVVADVRTCHLLFDSTEVT